MITNYKGRRIVTRPKKVDGFPAIAVTVNGGHVWTYPLYQMKTEAAVVEQIKRNIDDVDEKGDDADYEANWYADGDYRKARRLAKIAGAGNS